MLVFDTKLRGAPNCFRNTVKMVFKMHKHISYASNFTKDDWFGWRYITISCTRNQFPSSLVFCCCCCYCCCVCYVSCWLTLVGCKSKHSDDKNETNKFAWLKTIKRCQRYIHTIITATCMSTQTHRDKTHMTSVWKAKYGLEISLSTIQIWIKNFQTFLSHKNKPNSSVYIINRGIFDFVAVSHFKWDIRIEQYNS